MFFTYPGFRQLQEKTAFNDWVFMTFSSLVMTFPAKALVSDLPVLGSWLFLSLRLIPLSLCSFPASEKG